METLSFSSLPTFSPKSKPNSTPKSVKISEKIVPQRRKRSFHEIIFKPLHNLISTFNKNLPPLLDPKHVLSGGLSPVGELPPTACEVVEGSLPPCLHGAYIQNGANPQFFPIGPYHYVDGDGMLHSMKISQNGAVFCSRFIKTFRYTTENEFGYPIFPAVVAFFSSDLTASMALSLARFLTGQFNPFVDGFGTANTSLALIAGRLFALAETDLPYEVKLTSDGDIITVGRHDFNSKNHFLTMTAHPKSDPQTGETFAFRYFILPPFLNYFRIDSEGRKQKEIPIIRTQGLAFVHDFAVTKNYAVFPDPQVVIKPLEVLRGRRMLNFDGDKVPRLGVIPRYAEDERELFWVDSPGFNMLHTVNSWEEDDGGKIVIVAANVFSDENTLEKIDKIKLEKIIIDVKRKKIVMRFPVSSRNLDFGAINTRYSGKKNRYIYASVIENMPKMVGLVKIDLSLCTAANCDGGTVAIRMYGPNCYGSEPLFVARDADVAEEDDGYVVAYVNNENTKESYFMVMDAKSPTLETVAAVKLPRMVPQGFHSVFVKESDLQKL